jgi:nucleotide-binding universal stress UspA family protein
MDSSTKQKEKRSLKATDLIALSGAAASMLGLGVTITVALGISTGLAISIVSVMASIFAGVYSKEIAQTVRKLSRVKRVFVSYSLQSEAEAIADGLALLLRKKDVKVWMAKEQVKAGESFEGIIERAIEDADTFIVLLDKDLSANVSYEIGYALAKGKKIIPVLLKSGKVPNDLKGIKYIDLTKGGEKIAEEVIEAAT